MLINYFLTDLHLKIVKLKKIDEETILKDQNGILRHKNQKKK
jgi:hypothetical protein